MFHWLSINLTIKIINRVTSLSASCKKSDILFYIFLLSNFLREEKKKNSTMSDLPALRQKIDSLDTTLVNILNERARVSLSIGAAKRRDTYVNLRPMTLLTFFLKELCCFCSKEEDLNEADVQVYRPGREKEIYKKVRTSRTFLARTYNSVYS